MKLRKTMAALMLAACSALGAADRLIKDGDRLAIIGDSITEQKLYSAVMETYILACSGLKDVQVIQFGHGGERADGYYRRMQRNQEFFPATVATTCYGMNDGLYLPVTPATVEAYGRGSERIAEFMKKNNVRLLAGSPGAVDTTAFRRQGVPPDVYNNTLNELGKRGAKAALKFGAKFVDVHTPLIDAMAAAKKQYGAAYHVCGVDGVHPMENGHLVMAYAFLKGLGFDGSIGRIDMDFSSGATTATDGHKVLQASAGRAELESSRYPYVFTVGAAPNKNASILPFVPFNQDLNRFTLTVKNLPSARATVQFGAAKKSFGKAQLEAGINLADEFIADTPFRANFEALLNAVTDKQSFETWVGKTYMTLHFYKNLTAAQGPKLANAAQTIDAAVKTQWLALNRKAHEAMKPVRYTIAVTPEK